MYTRDEILAMLTASGDAQQALFTEARRQRTLAFGHEVIIRGVSEITNLCRVNCDYCPMRKDNTRANPTYLLKGEDLLAIAAAIKEAGIKVVFFQAGEIPQTTKLVGEIIPQIKAMFNGEVEMLLNLGNKPKTEYAYLKAQGADSYIIKHETSDPVLHQKIRHEPLAERLRYMGYLLELGYKVGTGTIVGLPGQRVESIADDILLARDLGVHMSSAAPFIPAPNTPFAHAAYGSVEMTLNAMAAMRLVNPTWLIPSVSALEKSEEGGQHRGLEAGANVLTINFTPKLEQQKYLIYGKDRYVVRESHVIELLAGSGLHPSMQPNDAQTAVNL